MKKYKIINKDRFYLCIAIIIIIGFILFIHIAKLQADKNENYKNNDWLTSEQQEFLDNWNGIPYELSEWMDTYEEDSFKELDIPLSLELQKYTYEMCKKYGVDYIFAMSIMAVESNYNVKAECKNNTDRYYSRGLFQLNERYISEFSELTGIKNFDINNVYHNIEGGIAKLAQLDRFWQKYDLDEESMFYAVLNSYNKGLNMYKREVVSRGGFFSRDYDRKVLKHKTELEESYYNEGGM